MKLITRLTDDFGRMLAYVPDMPVRKGVDPDPPYSRTSTYVFESDKDPNLVTSRTVDGKHLPVFDLDFPCRLIESQTPGHFHLYIDHQIEEWQFRQLLRAFQQAELVQKRWVENFERNGTVGLRLPKPDPAEPF